LKEEERRGEQTANTANPTFAYSLTTSKSSPTITILMPFFQFLFSLPPPRERAREREGRERMIQKREWGGREDRESVCVRV